MDSIYEQITHESIDLVLDHFEAGYSVARLAGELGYAPDVVQHMLACAYFDEGRIDKAEGLAREAVDKYAGPETHNLLLRCLLASPRDTKQEFHDESVRWAALYEDKMGSGFDQAKHGNREPEKILRLGFLCDYLGDTLFGAFLAFPLFDRLRKGGAKVYLYNFGAPNSTCDDATDICRDVRALSSDALGQQIHDDEIDILFDLNGRLRVNNRYAAMIKRPAPIQVSYMNLGGTSGLGCIDYVVTDENAVPPEDDRYYTEQVCRLPCGANGAFLLPGAQGAYKSEHHVPVGPSPVKKQGFVTFGSFNATFKLSDESLGAWAEILQRVPDSRLLLKSHFFARRRMRERVEVYFAKQKIAPERITIEEQSPFFDMWRRYGDVDIALDTMPYTGGSTTLHALWQGVPVITRRGSDWRGRMPTSMLMSARLDELVTPDRDSYIEAAVALANDRKRLAAYRRGMRARLRKAAYFDADAVAGDMLAACRKMWRDWLAHSSEPEAEVHSATG